jgi:hypothetical protein
MLRSWEAPKAKGWPGPSVDLKGGWVVGVAGEGGILLRGDT